jgi:TRAP-type C4-dicarboxylate transport system permease small subunit
MTEQMIAILAWVDRIFIGLCKLAILLSTLLLVVLVLFLVADRLALHVSFMGSHELALMSAMWLYMVGGVVAIRNREHITVDYLARKLVSPTAQALHRTFIAVLVLAFAIFFAKIALSMVEWAMLRPQRTPAMRLPLIWSQSAIVFIAFFSVIYTLRDVIEGLIDLRKARRQAGERTVS